MEALAIIGGAAALIQVASSGGWFARGIYRFAKDAGAAAAEIERFGNQVQASAGTIEVALIVLNRYCTEHSSSALVSYIATRKVLVDIDTGARLVLGHMESIVSQINSIASKSTFWTNIRWTLKRTSILELCPEIERVKSSLILLMMTVQFDARVSSRPTGEDDGFRKELRALRHAIKRQLRTIARLNLQLSRSNTTHPDLGSVEAPMGAADNQEEALMYLGWSVYKHGTIPNSSPGPAGAAPDLREARDSWTAGSSASIDTVTASSSSALPGSQGDHTAPTPNVPNPRPFSRSLSLKTDYFTDRTSGYISTPSGSPRHATAVLVRTLEGNVISARRATQLGLHVRPLGPTEGVILEFGTRSPERSIGRVTFQWRRGMHDDPQYPPLTVDCDVCEDYPVGLILGKPFLREKSRRWSGKGVAA